MTTRRRLVAGVLAMPWLGRGAHAQARARVVVIGGGFGGATAARFLRRTDPRLAVTLVAGGPDFTACPMSNAVIAGLRDIAMQRFTYAALAAEGVEVLPVRASAVDPAARRVTLASGGTLAYDRLILSPGVEPVWNAVRGYDAAAAEAMPHGWEAGAQTVALRDRLAALPDGGTVLISAPATPYRCPPAPYERAGLIANALKTRNPRAKVLLLDAKDSFSQQKLFEQAWEALYPGMIERIPLSDGGNVVEVDAAAGTVATDFETYRPDLANIIPPQRAGAIAAAAGVADRTGWCPVEAVTFESTLQPGIHVIGDAALAGAMSKSAFAASSQGKHVAGVVASLLAGEAPPAPLLMSACYSSAAPDWAFSIVSLYRPEDGQMTEIHGAGGTSPLDAPRAQRAREAEHAEAWFRAITRETFG